MKKPEKPTKPVDINLDSEPIAESPLDAAGEVAKQILESAGGTPIEEASAELIAVIQQMARLQAEKDDLHQTLVRRQADFENFRKRTERERQEDGRRSTMQVLEGFLPVLDAFERALAAPVEPGFEQHRIGFDLIYKQLWEGVARHGLERIEAVGKPFDPFLHQAIDRMETTDHEDGTVLEEYQRGYKIRDRVLRPSMVRVASNPGSASGDAAVANTTVN